MAVRGVSTESIKGCADCNRVAIAEAKERVIQAARDWYHFNAYGNLFPAVEELERLEGAKELENLAIAEPSLASIRCDALRWSVLRSWLQSGKVNMKKHNGDPGE